MRRFIGFCLVSVLYENSIWRTDERTQNIRLDSIKRSRTLKKDENLLTIGGCGGCSKIIPAFEKILQRNSISAVGEAFDKVVIITDRDEVGTEEEFIEKINTSVQKYQLMMKDDIKNNTWLSCEYQNGHGKKQIMELLLLVIPFEDTGAMETFLLNAIANDSAYDAEIIRKGNQFVEEVDKERKHLTKRRYITKSKFDVYFSIRTAAEQFVERQNILKRVPWEQYSQIQEEFQKLKDLTYRECGIPAFSRHFTPNSHRIRISFGHWGRGFVAFLVSLVAFYKK